MSIFGTILHKIFGTTPAEAAPAAAAAPAPARPLAPGVPVDAAGKVDIVAVLDDLNEKNPETLDWRVSIVDLLKVLGLDSSLAHRKELAAELKYDGDTNDSAKMNMWLHDKVIAQVAANGGKVPGRPPQPRSDSRAAQPSFGAPLRIACQQDVSAFRLERTASSGHRSPSATPMRLSSIAVTASAIGISIARARAFWVRIRAVQAPSVNAPWPAACGFSPRPMANPREIIARLRRGTGQGQVSQSGKAHDCFRPRALRCCEAHQFGEAARQQGGMGAGAESTAHSDAAGDGQHIFRRAANFDADQIARPIQPEMRRREAARTAFQPFDRLCAAKVTAVGRPRARSTAKLGPDRAATGWPGSISANTSLM